MAFFNSAVTVLQTLVIALGAGLGIWGAINLLEGYGNDNPGAKFFNSAVTVLQTLVIALGAGLGIWGAINLLEGYGNDNPGANAHVR